MPKKNYDKSYTLLTKNNKIYLRLNLDGLNSKEMHYNFIFFLATPKFLTIL